MSPPFASPSKARVLLLFFGLALFGVCCTLLVFQPGCMSEDSFHQYEQARWGRYENTNPPIMAFVWHYFNVLSPGQFPMLLFHALVYWIGLALLFVFLRLPLGFRVVGFLAVGFFPPAFGLLGMVWKDVGVQASALMVCGLIMAYRGTRKPWLLAVSLLFIFYLVSVRHNSVAAAVSLFAWVAASLFGDRVRSFRAFAVCVLVGLVLSAALYVASKRLLGLVSHDSHPEQGEMMYDLIGTSIQLGQSVIPDNVAAGMLRQNNDVESMKLYYSTRTFIVTARGLVKDGKRQDPFFVYTQDPVLLKSLSSAWIGAIFKHPVSYGRHRWAVFKEAIGLSRNELTWPVIWWRIVPNEYDMQFVISPVNDRMTLCFLFLSRTLLYRAWLYGLVLLLLVTAGFVALRRGKGSGLLAVSSSSLGYFLFYLIVVPASDFRFQLWTITGCMVSLWFALALAYPALLRVVSGAAGEAPAAHVETDTMLWIGNEEGVSLAEPATIRRQIRALAVSTLAAIGVVVAVGFLLSCFTSKNISQITLGQVELSRKMSIPAGETLKVCFVNGVAPKLLKRLEYRLCVTRKPQDPNWIPVSDFNSRFPSYTPDAVGRLHIALDVKDKASGKTQRVILNDFDVRAP
jgi:hypothetical protein